MSRVGGEKGGVGAHPQKPVSAAVLNKKKKMGGSRSLNTVSYAGDAGADLVCFESEPMLTLPKKSFPKLGRMKKTTLLNLKMAEAKFNAQAIMSSKDPDTQPRYAKTEKFLSQQRHNARQKPSIEVLEADGATLLGIPGTSSVQQFASYMEGTHRKQIVIAMHDEPVRRRGPGGSSESDATVMRSGVAMLSKQLSTLRDSLAASRTVHNTYANEAQKYFAGPKY
mmetsp:Transcript_7512/g.14692  ORF Transcript_7512/g.14692 Transcript_7512/m.14692 type:complete len:224 (+) Transcript_7512:50-721(+)